MDGPTMQAVVPPIVAYVDTVSPQTPMGWAVAWAQVVAGFGVIVALVLNWRERVITSRPYLHLFRERTGALHVVNAGRVHAFDTLVKVRVERVISFGHTVSDEHDSHIDLGGVRPALEAPVDLATYVSSLARRELLPKLKGTPFASTRAWAAVHLTVMYTGASHMDAFTDTFRVDCDCRIEHAHKAPGVGGIEVHDFTVTRTVPLQRSARSYRHRLPGSRLLVKIVSWFRRAPPRED